RPTMEKLGISGLTSVQWMGMAISLANAGGRDRLKALLLGLADAFCGGGSVQVNLSRPPFAGPAHRLAAASSGTYQLSAAGVPWWYRSRHWPATRTHTDERRVWVARRPSSWRWAERYVSSATSGASWQTEKSLETTGGGWSCPARKLKT